MKLGRPHEIALTSVCAIVLATVAAYYAFPGRFARPVVPNNDMASRMCENHVAPDEAGYAGPWDEPCQKIMAARLEQKMVGWRLEAEAAHAEDIYELRFVQQAAQEQK